MTPPVVLVFVGTRDLFFRAKLEGAVRSAGGEPARETECALAVLGLDDASAERIQALTARGVEVLVFGPHVDAARLRTVRELGVKAVPNSQVESAIRERVGYLSQVP